MYATANGHIAEDGNESTNGVFTERLLKYMDTSLTLMEISIAIAKDLKEEDQKPYTILNMEGDYRFRPLANEHVDPQRKLFSPKYERNNRFVDRPSVFEILNHTIKTHRECTLCGLGGIGKSQIATRTKITTDIFSGLMPTRRRRCKIVLQMRCDFENIA